MNKSELKKLIREEISKKLNENEINFIPQDDTTHHIVFNNPMDAERKLDDAGIDYDNVGFVLPKMSRETWMTIKELFNSDEVGDMGIFVD